MTLVVVVQQFFDVSVAFATVSAHTQAFEQFTARSYAFDKGSINLGFRYRFANANVHESFLNS
jgi:hypothetical protein